eukprot:jgi/Chlat1/4907/Chrsp31S04821
MAVLLTELDVVRTAATGGSEPMDTAAAEHSDGSASDTEKDVCWICLQHEDALCRESSNGAQPQGENKPARRWREPLVSGTCKCPRHVHMRCLAQWQLRCAGKRQETHCQFCDSQLPDWRTTLLDPAFIGRNIGIPVTSSAMQCAVMNVTFQGQRYSFPASTGSDGLTSFVQQVRNACSLPTDVDLDMEFKCIDPISGFPLTLRGMGAFDTAVRCAAINAFYREMRSANASAAAARAASSAAAVASETSQPLNNAASDMTAASCAEQQQEQPPQPVTGQGRRGREGLVSPTSGRFSKLQRRLRRS